MVSRSFQGTYVTLKEGKKIKKKVTCMLLKFGSGLRKEPGLFRGRGRGGREAAWNPNGCWAFRWTREVALGHASGLRPRRGLVVTKAAMPKKGLGIPA